MSVLGDFSGINEERARVFLKGNFKRKWLFKDGNIAYLKKSQI